MKNIVSAEDLVVLLHGFLGSPGDFEGVRQFLPDCKVYCPDIPGHGDFKIDENDSSDTLLTKLAADILEHAGGRKIILVGYSMGGRLAMWISRRIKGHLSAMVLISASPGIIDFEQRQQRCAGDSNLSADLKNGVLKTFLENWYQQPLFAPLLKVHSLIDLISKRINADPIQLAMALEKLGVGQQPDFWPLLTARKFPLLYLAGNLDIKYSAIAAKLAMKRASIVVGVLEECGHALHLEQPEELAQFICTFLYGSPDQGFSY
jgi:2-succinyl-6-hydroxy-2,4-cyclohexadiene-1-carboxylate synthase